VPTFEQIRPLVLREWQSEQRTQSSQAFLDSLRAKYDIRIEGPAGALSRQPQRTDGARSP
jgi:hypothetical protein